MDRIECPDNPLMQEDMDAIAKEFPLVDRLKGKSFFITGGTGLIGSQVIKALGAINRTHDAGIKIHALARSEEKAKRVLGSLIDRGDVQIVKGDIFSFPYDEMDVDYIIHGASPTGSKFFVEKPVETIKTAIDGTIRLLEMAKDKKVGSMVYLSSLEVYGTPDASQEWMKENDFGQLDPAKVRSSYSEGKRMAECLCASYASEYGVPVKMARLSQTFGPGVEYDDGRVFMDFTRHALEGQDVILHTKGQTLRTYLYTKDAVTGILYILLAGENGESYNITNKETGITILQMAEMVCETVGKGKVSAKVEIPDDIAGFGYNPEMVIRLDTSKLEALGWKATVGFPDMFIRLADGVVRK